jgi:hypothetical protein
MFSYIIGFLLLSKFGVPKPIRYAFLLFMAGLLIVVAVYTTNLFLTLSERAGVQHGHSHSTY